MFSGMRGYEATDTQVWQGRNDGFSARFFQRVACIDLRTQSLANRQGLAFIGFCCDEGIRRNAGRVGAKDGPDALRQQLAKLACHGDGSYLDVGNIRCDDGDLEAAQEQFAMLVNHCHQQGLKTVAFGGGHELAFAHFNGLALHYPSLGMINIDAHFDTRAIEEGRQGNSGTSFWQIKLACEQQKRPFGYCCLGIQSIANTHALFERAREWRIPYLTALQMHQESVASQMAFLDDFILRYSQLYLTICLDAFSEACAPGVSAPQSLGLMPLHVLPLLKYIQQTGKVISIDVVELSPPLDHEQKTSRLAASIVAELLNL